MNSVESIAEKAKTGIWGLDNILSGGFSRGHLFLVEGAPGTGENHHCAAITYDGRRAGRREMPLLSPSPRPRPSCAKARLLMAGSSATASRSLSYWCPRKACSMPNEQQQSSLYSSDLELRRNHRKQIFEAVERARPSRVVLDSLSEISSRRKARCVIGGGCSRDQALLREVRLHGAAA